MAKPLLGLALALLGAAASAQTRPIDPSGVPGARLIAGGGALPDAVYARFLELAGGPERAHVVLIPTASERADTAEGREATLQRWREQHPGFAFELLHTRDRAEADDEGFCAPLRRATAVWFGGGAQARLAAAYVGTRVEREIAALLQRGGVVGGSSAGAAIQTRTMIQEGRDPPVLGRGLDLVPFAIADQHFLARERLPRLLRALAMAPGHFGIGVDEGTAVLVRGRDVEVLGASKALFVLPPAHGEPERVVALAPGERADLVTWQRAARQRGDGRWPRPTLPAARLERGSLVLVGGGALPEAVVQRFVALAGGPERARIVVVPAATPAAADDSGDRRIVRTLRAAGANDVRTLDARHPADVDEAALAMLADATGIWFGGGRQWRLVDAFEGTPAIEAFHAVLARGGVIGGSSAGATIQGELLVRGNPLGNTEMWCEGYGRGFGFLPGCAVDQHFLARGRTADLASLIARFPQAIGLGIDEGTAAVVTGATLEVLGTSKIAVFDARTGEAPAAPTWLEPGQRWDLVQGTRLP